MPRRNRNNKKNEGDYGSPAWMTTYGDMVTLLLTFFVLLYSFSAVDLERFSEVMSAIQHSFLGRTGILMGTIEVGDAEGRKIDVAESAVDAEIISEQEAAILEMMAELEETYEEVRAFLLAAGLEEDVMLRMEERSIVMELPEKFSSIRDERSSKLTFAYAGAAGRTFGRPAQPGYRGRAYGRCSHPDFFSTPVTGSFRWQGR